ncbi:cysteine desulfurase NifS [Clostridium aestuarii]|uniref:Cysteine desulfurase IscS n=1 Tax=Clostridium aestuarii TaxID=338193 RepID=A0ABT4D0F8_9CLOT|nr:cysteine desulfurase NifS [Clostridium aestuarii]MCY6484719.1 cysteine desulfurase NifS [Clostridium aestuarii]
MNNMKRNIYIDYAATTYMKSEVLEEMNPYFTEYFGNPSSIHFMSRKTKSAIDKARRRVAKVLNSKADEIFFTSGGSESDNWGIKGVAFANEGKGNHIITTKIEHHAVLNTCKYLEKHGFKVTYLSVNKEGMISLEELKNAISDKTILVSIMFANNEIGTIQPIKEIGEICRAKNVLFHTDAVQATGHVFIDVDEMNIDLLSLSAHKFYGPKGIGVLYIKKGIKIDNLIHGGSQQRAKRSGTENVAGIVGLGKAIELAEETLEEERNRLILLRDKLIDGLLKIPYSKLNGAVGEKRLPGNVNISFEFVDGEALFINLDTMGICASSGSACSAGSVEPSHVLDAIGIPQNMIDSTVRFSMGEKTTEEDIDYLLKVMSDIIERIRKLNSEYKQKLRV